VVKPLCANSCPPLKPMENNKYREINLLDDAGISRSLFIMTARTPSTKNNRVGLVRFDFKI